MTQKYCTVCPHVGNERNHARHMRQAHHRYLCEVHMDYVMAIEYATKSTGWLEIGASSTDWWKILELAKRSLARQLSKRLESDSDVKDDLEPDNFDHSPAEHELVDEEAEVVQQADDVDDLATVQELLISDQQSSDGSNASLPSELKPRIIFWAVSPDPEYIKMLDDAVKADAAVQVIATFGKALLGHRVKSISCIREMDGDKTWAPGLTDMTYGANAVCSFGAVYVASEFDPRMASLLVGPDAMHPLVLFLRGQSGSGKTWLTRNLLQPLEGVQISITLLEGGASTPTIPQAKNKANTVKLTKRPLGAVPCWSRTAKTSANESFSRAVVAYRMDVLLLIDMPGGEEVGDGPEETSKINTANMEVLATPYAFHTGTVSTTCSRNPAVQFVL
ncbi:hypothetical protein FN846DRAFT_893163 [Sphaerosporella brunnea]|uniref:Uncharacterized protein n=1 Tax=Sphaerosporella brunnea TaxID=1250544 RepID=A0A5J5ELQ5_9PEZI|nr:hypothetical protein FN846DRAFT_893163 [Sphaerosporella brunnea]